MSKSEKRGHRDSVISPLPSLATFVASEHRNDEWISFPQGTEAEIKTYQSLGTKFPKKEIQQLVEALDVHEYHFCSRLDELSLALLSSIFTFSEPCGARYRGYHIIAEAIHSNSHDSQAFIEHKYANKSGLCNLLPQLLELLIRGPEQDEPRRWMSVLVLELLEECPENVHALRDHQSNEWQGLTRIIKHCECEILRLLTGSIVRRMLCGGVKPDMLWTAEDPTDWIQKFPITSKQNTQWIGDFEAHMHNMFKLNLLPGRKSYVAFAGAAVVGKRRYLIEDGSAIFVSVCSNQLQLFVKVSPYDLATQISIPLLNIESHEITSITSVHDENSMYTTHIRLSDSADVPFFINAKDQSERDLEISFRSHKTASDLGRFISARRKRKAATENTERIAGKGRKKAAKKTTEDSQEVSDVAQKPPTASMARQNLDDDDHVMKEQLQQPSLAPQVAISSQYTEARAIAAGATSLLASSEQASASAQQSLPKPGQGASQSQRWQGLKRSKRNDDELQVIPDSLEVDVRTQKHTVHAKAFEASRTLPGGKHSSNAGKAEEVPALLGITSEAAKVKPGRAISAYTEPDGIETQAPNSKRRKLSQQLRDEHGEIKRSNHTEANSKTRDASPRLNTFKPLNSRLQKKPKTMLVAREQRVDSRLINGEKTKEDQFIEISGPDQDLYEFPLSPVNPKKTASVNRITKASTRKTYGSKRKSTVANHTQTPEKPLKGQTARHQAPKALTQPKSRRAAAIHANEMIQGVDNSTPPSLTEGRQEDANKQQAQYSHKEIAEARSDTAGQDDSIETVQTADEIIPVPQDFVQDSIETVGHEDERLPPSKRSGQNAIRNMNNENKTLSAKEVAQKSTGNGYTAKSGTMGHDNQIVARSVDREQRFRKQAAEDPKTANEAAHMPLDSGKEIQIPDSVQERSFQEISVDRPQSKDRDRATQHEIDNDEINEASQKAGSKAQAVTELPEKGFDAHETTPIEKTLNEQVPNEDSFKDGVAISTSKQTRAGPGSNSLLKDGEGALNLNAAENGRTHNNEADTPKSADSPNVHDSTANRDPFFAKLNKVVKGEEITEVIRPTHIFDTAKSGDRSDNPPGTPKKSLRHSLLQEGRGNVRTPILQYSTSNPNKPAARPKRKADGVLTNLPKIPRIDVHGIDGTTDKFAKRTPPIATRKTAIISFNASGPRNQGTARKKDGNKTRPQPSEAVKVRRSGTVGNTTDDSEVTSVAIVSLEKPQQHGPRKVDVLGSDEVHVALDDGEPIVFDEDQQPEHVSARISQQEKFGRLDTKPGSQTTRVNYNGSPMPARHPTNERSVQQTSNSEGKNRKLQVRQHGQELSNLDEGFSSDSEEGDDHDDEEEDEEEEYEDDKVPEPTLPSRHGVSQPSMPQIGAYNWTGIAKNSKQVPSSPHETSATAALPPHHIDQGGQIINTSTHELVVPSNPPDPFVAHAAMPSSFMRLLQNANEKYNKQQSEANMNDRSKRIGIPVVLSPNDPDRTMVEPSFSRRSKKFHQSKDAASSNSSEDTPEEEVSRTLIEKNVEDTPTQWKKALMPHQKNTLEVLNEISHRLLAHMIRGEDAILDLVQDFKKSGNKLIDHLDKELEKEMAARIAATAVLEKRMLDLFSNTMKELKDSEGQIVGRATQVETDLKAHQQSLLASTEAALALCKS